MKPAPAPAAIALAGLLSLAVAMGIGRFAFTPLLPLMIREGQLDIAAGGWVAAANYLGYFVGALTAARLRIGAALLGSLALLATAALAAAMAPAHGTALWVLLRFASGVASAWSFVATSVWCLGALAHANRGDLGGWVYTGVGTGIALAGLHSLLGSALQQSAPALWVQLGVLALVLSVPAMLIAHRTHAPAPAARTVGHAALPAGTRGVVIAYGLMGFGYILPATFLPVLARSVVDDPRIFGLVWPMFGATAALSTVLAGWWLKRVSRLAVWSAAQLAMGIGVLLPSLWVSGATVTLSALLVGGTFMVVTLAGVQELRARASGDPRPLIARGTAAFALGQIAGPALSSLLLHVPLTASHGLALGLQGAAAALLASGAWLAREAFV